VWDSECSLVKIADLGVAKVKETLETLRNYGQAGTPTYWAPEMHREEPYGTSADVFSFALVVWELYAMEKPYKGWTLRQLMKEVGDGAARPSPVTSMPAGIASLVQHCWQKDPRARAEMKAVVAKLDELKLQAQ